MSVARETIQVPKQLYLRLWRLAEREKTEPVQLIEQWLDRALPQDDDGTEDNATEPIAPIYYLHVYAEDLGVTDLAQNIDHYLYGQRPEQSWAASSRATNSQHGATVGGLSCSGSRSY